MPNPKPTIKVICVAGARPNFVKVAPLLRVFRQSERLHPLFVHTGQHYSRSLSADMMRDLGLPEPDIALGIDASSVSAQTAEILVKFAQVLRDEQPEVVVVVGDVTSTLACALATVQCRLHKSFSLLDGESRHRPLLVHVEAGLRSFDSDMPEEMNRRLTDNMSDLLFATEPQALDNLRAEGRVGPDVIFAGNVMIDSLLAREARIDRPAVLEGLELAPQGYGLVTLHRPSNVDEDASLSRLLTVLRDLSTELPLIFPVHPRSRDGVSRAIGDDVGGVVLTEPFGYLDFVDLMTNARLVLTDSGGIQEETTALGVPCLTLRENTERPITITEGTNKLVGLEPKAIRAGFAEALKAPRKATRPELWDGRAAERICAAIEAQF